MLELESEKVVNKSKQLGLFGTLAIMLSSSLTIMVGSALTPALPEIGRHFLIKGNLVSWLVTIPALGVVCCAIFMGRLIEKKGAYVVLSISLIAYGLLGFIGFLMPNVAAILFERFLLGAATAGVMASSTDMIPKFYTGAERLKMVSIQGMSIELGGVLFLGVGGSLANLSWKGPFFIYLVAFVAFGLLILFVPKYGSEVSLQEENSQSANVENENRNSNNVNIIFLIAFFGMLIFFSAIVTLPSYLQSNFNFTAGDTGFYLAFISILAVIFAGIMPKLVAEFGSKVSLICGYGSYVIGHTIFFFAGNIEVLIIAALFLGIGFGLSHPLSNHLVIERSSASKSGINLSYFAMATFLGQFLASMIASISASSYIYLLVALIALFLVTFTLITFKNK